MTDKVIRLNVGGRFISTSRSTLTKCKDSLLERMFQEDSLLAPSCLVDGAFFIDADPDVFCAILTWLRHGVIDQKWTSMDHLAAAASYFGLEDLCRAVKEKEEEDEKRRKEEEVEKEARRREFYEKKMEALKWALEAVANNVKDLPNFVSQELLEFQVAMAIGSLEGGTLTQICRHICTRQLSENSHTAPQDICTLVMFTLKRMRDKPGPLRVREDEIGVWNFLISPRG